MPGGQRAEVERSGVGTQNPVAQGAQGGEPIVQGDEFGVGDSVGGAGQQIGKADLRTGDVVLAPTAAFSSTMVTPERLKELLMVRTPIEVPGARRPADWMVTGPLMKPLPPSVPPVTVTALVPMTPLTRRVPALTVVTPV